MTSSAKTDDISVLPVWNLMSTAVLITDKKGTILWGNQAAEVLLGRSLRMFSGDLLGELLPEAKDGFKDRESSLPTVAMTFSGTLRKTLRSGLRGSVQVRGSVTAVEEGRFADLPAESALMVELTDIEESVRSERENAAAGLMEANRQLLRNLAHEIKNPLGGIRGAAQLLDCELTNEEDRECTRIVIEEADRLQALVDRFLAPYRKAKNLEPVNLHEVLEYVKSLITLEYPSGLRFERDYDISAPSVEGDRARLTQVFLNLARNAAEALASQHDNLDPVIALRTRIVRNAVTAAGRTRLALAVDVEDNGPGIPEDMIEKIFYPLVTGRAEGSGLGLSLAQTFVRQAGGTLSVESMPGKTVFRVVLPFSVSQTE